MRSSKFGDFSGGSLIFTISTHNNRGFMNFLAQTIRVLAIALVLFYAGFYLTGLLAVHVNYQDFGLSAATAFAPMMLLAWGLPAGVVWLVVGLLMGRRAMPLAAIGAAAQTALLLASSLAERSSNQWGSELGAVVATFGWPVVFIAAFALGGAFVGAYIQGHRVSRQTSAN